MERAKELSSGDTQRRDSIYGGHSNRALCKPPPAQLAAPTRDIPHSSQTRFTALGRLCKIP